jgi:LPS-assembly protein
VAKGQYVIVMLVLLSSPVWGAPPPSVLEMGKIRLTSDRLEYGQEEGIYLAKGNATLTMNEMRLTVNSLWFNNTTRQLRGHGDVTFTKGANTILAREITFDLSTGEGTLLDGRLFIDEENYTLTGTRIIRLGGEHYRLEEASFTACDCTTENPDWQIRARQIDARLDQYLVAKELGFYAGKSRILKLPYLIFPMKTTRQTGLLIPEMGYSKTLGVRYSQDLFLALAQNHDATLSVDFRDRKGSGGGLEYRYALSQGTRGTLQANAFHDLEKTVDRLELRYWHEQRISDRTALNINAHSINPSRSFLAVSDDTNDRALQNMESTASLTYRGDTSFAYLLARYTQDLTAPNNELLRLPEIGWHLMEYPVGPLLISDGITATRFERNMGLPWDRVDTFSRMAIPINFFSVFTLTPWAESRTVGYSRTTLADDPLYRKITATGAELNADWHGSKVPIRLSQQVFYEQIRVEDRSDILEADDIDRLHRRDSVTLSLNPQLTSPNGADPLVSVRLTETYQDNLYAPATKAYSDLRGEVALRPFSSLSLVADTFYNWDNEELVALNTDLDFNVRDRIKIVIGERFTRGGKIAQVGDSYNPLYLGDLFTVPRIQFLTGHFLVRFAGGMHVAAKAYYDRNNALPVEAHYGLMYLTECWSATLAYQDLPERNEIFFSVHLKGLGGARSNRFAYLFDF